VLFEDALIDRTIAEAQSLVAVQPIWILVCRINGPNSEERRKTATARNLVIERSRLPYFLTTYFLSIFYKSYILSKDKRRRS